MSYRQLITLTYFVQAAHSVLSAIHIWIMLPADVFNVIFNGVFVIANGVWFINAANWRMTLRRQRDYVQRNRDAFRR